ncbi:GTPase Era, mitochondrial [Armigeres subalbatus]|uniref:GTPase Era, mitochondrial n=1 Tax=Armigeres subalbatus TaxID=124917 RepID=UPI002ED21C38
MLDKALSIIARRSVSRPVLFCARNFSAKISENVSDKKDPQSNEKLIKVAIIGVPNAGKSTLINHLINHRVCPTSMKVHTTRSTARAIQSRANSQLVLFDTPGLVGDNQAKKHHIDANFLSSCRHAVQNSNLIGVVHDVSNSWTRSTLNPVMVDVLKSYSHIPSFLILNKIDTLKSKRVLLDIVKSVTNNELQSIKNYHIKERKSTHDKFQKEVKSKVTVAEVWPHFTEIFMVSAVTGDGLKEVMNFIYSHAKSGPWEHLASETTDQTPEQLIVQSVRARLLDYLPQEIPYGLITELEFFENINGKMFASAVVTCPSERLERLVCGEGNGKLRQITERVTSDLIETFTVPVVLTIVTRVQHKEK